MRDPDSLKTATTEGDRNRTDLTATLMEEQATSVIMEGQVMDIIQTGPGILELLLSLNLATGKAFTRSQVTNNRTKL
jgi:hypothetical protein